MTIGWFLLIAAAILTGIGAILVAISAGTQIADGPEEACEPDGPCELKCCQDCQNTRTPNEHGEIPDGGPPWACARFGAPGHDYQDCGRCSESFERYLQTNKIADPNYGPKEANL